MSVRQVIFCMHQWVHSCISGISIDGQGIETNQTSCEGGGYIGQGASVRLELKTSGVVEQNAIVWGLSFLASLLGIPKCWSLQTCPSWRRGQFFHLTQRCQIWIIPFIPPDNVQCFKLTNLSYARLDKCIHIRDMSLSLMRENSYYECSLIGDWNIKQRCHKWVNQQGSASLPWWS